MRRLTRFGSVCLGLGVAVLAGCGGSTPAPNDELTITASDGKMVLTVPAGALPVGTDPSTVKVTPIDVSTFGDDLTDGQLVSAYRLEPEGLKLSSPATLDVTFDPTVVKEMVGHHAGTGGDEILPLKVTDSTGSALTVTAAISHFSIVAFENTVIQSIETRVPPRNAFIGQPFTVRYRLTPRLMGDKEYLRSRPADRNHITLAGTSALSETWNSTTWHSIYNSAQVLTGPVSPAKQTAPDMPTDLNMPGLVSNFRDFDFTFKCNSMVPGPYSLDFAGSVETDLTETYVLATDPDGTPMDILHCAGGQCCFPGDVSPCDGTCSSDADCMNKPTVSVDEAFTLTEHSSQDSANCLMPTSDPFADFIDSISSLTPAFMGMQVDLTAYGFNPVSYTQAQVDDTFNNSVYHCGDSNATRTVVCSGGGATPMPAGQVDTFFMQLAAPVPIADATKDYIYSVVLDSDGDPTNNWVPQASFDWDYFQGTDRWYQLVWDHTAGTWSLTATQVDATQGTTIVTSSARAVIEGDAITFFVSASELPAPTGYRVTAFGHDGMFTPSSRGGDVSGANPTLPLTAIP